MKRLSRTAALLVIDVQVGIDHPKHGRRNNPNAEENIARLLAAWRRTERPIIHVQHLSINPSSALRPNTPGVEIKEVVRPLDGEQLIQKHANSAFIGTDLTRRLRREGIDTLVITGLTTDHCVSATARMAGDLGYRTFVVADATATFGRVGRDGREYSPEEVHGVSLATLEGEFATIVNTEDVLQRIAPHTPSPPE